MDTLEYHLDFMEGIPQSVADLRSMAEIRQTFPNPTLVHCKGRTEKSVFVCLLQHGNETTGFHVLKLLQKHLENHVPTKSLYLFVSNVAAAAQEMRFLPDQQDFNRCWGDGNGPEQRLFRKVREALPEDLFATIDIHNNTGKNPYYACVSQLNPEHIYLGSLFSRTLVYFTSPPNALSRTFSERMPSVTLECGNNENRDGIEKAFQLVLDVLALDTLAGHEHHNSVEVYQTIGKIVVPPGNSYSFDGSEAQIIFPQDFENLNFSPLKRDFPLAKTNSSENSPLRVLNNEGSDDTDRFLTLRNGHLLLARGLTPSMLTTQRDVIEKDCLGYLMQKMSLSN